MKVLISALALAFASSGFGQTLLKFDGRSIKKQDLSPALQQQYFEAEQSFFEAQKRIAESEAIDRYLKQQSQTKKYKGKNLETVRKEFFAAKDPSDKELKDFYDKNKAKIPYPFEQIKPQLKHLVLQEQAQKKRKDLIAKLSKDKTYRLLLAEPKAATAKINTKGFASKGNNKAKVTVVEFADYKCPHCRHAFKAFQEILKTYDKKINFVFIDFPLSETSAQIAAGSHCAQEQNKYWNYHDTAFEEQGHVKTSEEIAKKAQLNMSDFTKCMKAERGKALVDAGKAEGAKLGISGTPAIFINGKRHRSGVDAKSIKAAIDKALAGASS